MTERRLSRPQIIDQARQGVEQAIEAQRQVSGQLEKARSRFGSLPSPLRAPLRALTGTGSKVTGLTIKAGEINSEVLDTQKLHRLLEESKGLKLETFKTYYKYDSKARTISIIRGRVNGTRIRVNRLQIGEELWYRDAECEYAGFRYDDELKMSQEEAQGIFRRYYGVLEVRNQQEGIKRSTLAGEHPLDYWKKITKPQPVSRSKSRR